MSNEAHEQQLQHYDAYRKHVELLNTAQLEIAGLYDKGILYVAGGALAVSVAFIEKIAPSPHGLVLWLLGAAWLLLIVGLGLHLMSLSRSRESIVREIEITYEKYEKEGKCATKNELSSGVPKLQKTSLWLTLVGVAFLCIFSFVSLITNPAQKYATPKRTKSDATETTSTTTSTTTVSSKSTKGNP